jgi:hypothetical protein
MPTRLTEIVVDCVETAPFAPIARFWSELLGWPITLDKDDEICIQGEEFDIVFGPVPEAKTVKNRVHLDVACASVDQQREIVAKALELGARHLDIGQGDVPWKVMADPGGNEFCVIDEMPQGANTGAIASVSMDCADPNKIAPFWTAAAGMSIIRQDPDFVLLRPESRPGPWLALDQVSDPKTVMNRVHIDIAPYAADDHVAEVERLIALGARRIDIGQGDVPWEVMADPEGNEFCVLTPRDKP